MALKVKINPKAVRQILQSKEVLADLERRAQAIAAAAGPGHKVTSRVGRNRARAEVRTDDTEARLAEATSRNLTASLDAARD